MPYTDDDYIGDGVYVSLDEAGQIWLAVGHHTNRVVALEPEVFRALVGYEERMRLKYRRT